MTMSQCRVDYYIAANGSRPVITWLERLDMVTRMKIVARIDRLACGSIGDSKSLGGGVHELRCDFGPGYRVYYAMSGTTVYILLCGGDKGSQKRDIARARRYWKDIEEK